ncbi:MtrAB system accessory lipoprotein LpqB [Corynebacterium cystitidis]|uniref:MtrAB system accessory lipoprotein LpqB n=1 Tax=Corynebacterium cystitidis TaxID=35757 RepID=UPI00211E0E2E|nr:MtrAB system accessory lipoprotein LpqB [Corynebacterium cystitidis]
MTMRQRAQKIKKQYRNSRGRHQRRLLALAVVSVATLTLGSCTRVPTSTEPQALRPFDRTIAEEDLHKPQPGLEPDLLLRDFYAASAIPAGDYSAARNYLTREAAEAWDPHDSMLIVDRIDLTTQPGGNAQRRSLTVRGEVIGSLEEGGSYVPQNGVYEATVQLEQVSGEWRIASLPAGVIMERTELSNQYNPHSIYFLNASGETLVPDRRWVYTGTDSLDSVLLSLLAAGPTDRLAPATASEFPKEAAYIGKTDGVYEFSGLSNMDRERRTTFAAQVVWTLARAGINGPYRILADGAPLLDVDALTPDDFAAMNPQVTNQDVTELYALTDSRLYSVDNEEATVVDGPLGEAGNVSSLDITASGYVAAVLNVPEDEGQAFSVGGIIHPQTEVLRAATITRPSFELDDNVAWVAIDGHRVIRSVRSSASGEVVSNEVGTAFLDDIDGEISVLRLSRSGARVAMIIDGRLYTGIVERTSAGERSIVNVLEYATDYGGSIISVDWKEDGALIVGTSAPDAPVLRVEQDGSAVTTLSTGNINAPVVMVAASPTMIYATDANAILQLPTQGNEYPNWREVPGLQGMRAAPVVAK